MKTGKTFLYSVILITLLVFFIGCSGSNSKNQQVNNIVTKSKSVITNSKSVELPVEGMSCMACVAKVKNALSGIEGLDDINVSLENNNATFRYNPQKTSLAKIKQAIDESGYKAGIPKELPE